MTVGRRIFRSSMKSWDKLCDEAAAFATFVRPERLINISHSEDDNEGVVIVWYWTDAELVSDDAAAGRGFDVVID